MRKLPDTQTHEVIFSPDRRQVAVRTQAGKIWLGDTRNSDLTRFVRGVKTPAKKIALGRGARMLVWYADGANEVWDAAAHVVLHRRQLEGRLSSWPVAASPDGRLVAVGFDRMSEENDAGFLIYDVDALSIRYVQTGKLADLCAIASSPDNRWLAAGWADGPIGFFDIATGEQTFTLSRHQHWVDSIAFSPDGRTLATAGQDGAIRLWNLATREELFVLRRLDSNDRVLIDFSPDGRRLVAAINGRQAHGRIFLWSTSEAR